MSDDIEHLRAELDTAQRVEHRHKALLVDQLLRVEKAELQTQQARAALNAVRPGSA